MTRVLGVEVTYRAMIGAVVDLELLTQQNA
jgi:hypothetical protein